jgi:hypothetical protein
VIDRIKVFTKNGERRMDGWTECDAHKDEHRRREEKKREEGGKELNVPFGLVVERSSLRDE